MTWVDGRRLSEIYFDDFGDMLFFDYDSDGMRLRKYGPRVYDYNYAFANTPLFYVDYYYDGDTLIYERRSYNGDNESTLFTIEYLYGVNGITGFRIHQGNTTTDYFYVKNIMGDVLGIVNASGTLVAEYRYDAYGNPVMILDGNGNDVSNNYAHIANINPIRYRGYYYDIESGFYYLNSRYYDPAIGRFINADGYVSTGQDVNGFNMFAYCGNNPVTRADPTGMFFSEIWEFAKTAVTEIGKAMGVMSPAYAWCGEAAMADGPLPFGDIVAIAGAALFTVGAIAYGTYQATQALSISIPKVDAKEDVAAPPPINSSTYYHVTTPENAAKIMSTGIMTGSSWEGGHVYAWKTNPSKYAIENSGAHKGVTISFKTTASFSMDMGISDPKVQMYGPVVSNSPGPIVVWDVQFVGVTK